jgi:hypothetical protein
MFFVAVCARVYWASCLFSSEKPAPAVFSATKFYFFSAASLLKADSMAVEAAGCGALPCPP